MGLIKAVGNVIGGGLNAVGGAFESGLWTEYFESGDMSNGILMKRGEKILSNKGRNRYSDNNLISSGSGIDVQENQCMIIVENGKVVEFCTEPGRYTYDSSLAPSLLCGENKGLKAFGKEILTQWKAGGQRFSTQRVYFINMGVLRPTILWGTGDIAFEHFERDINDNPVWKTVVKLQANGYASLIITDPVKFYQIMGAQVAGTDGNGIIRIDEDMKKILKGAITGKIRQAFGNLSKHKIQYSEIVDHEDDIKNSLNELLDAEWSGLRGIAIHEFVIEGQQPREEDVKRIQEYQDTVGYSANPNMANVNVQRTLAQGFKVAGENGGPSNIVGMGMGMGMMGGGLGNMNFQANQPQQPQVVSQPAPKPPIGAWKCSCGTDNAGKFCINCGSSKPNEVGTQALPDLSWVCTCGTTNEGKFCPNCGSKKPAIKKYQCDKCGWKPEDETKLPKFCPECGDIFNEEDVQEI